ARLALVLEECGAAGVPVDALPVRLGVAPAALAQLLLASAPSLTRLGDRLFAAAIVEQLEARLLERLRAMHEAHPLEPGASLQLLRSQLAVAPELADHVVARAVAGGRVEVHAGTIRISGWSARVTPAQQDALQRLRDTLAAAAHEPPSVDELAASFGGNTESLLRHLEREGQVVQVEPRRFYAAPAVEALVRRLRAGMQPARAYAPSELRDLLGFSRKFLIPFLEYCDRRGLTARSDAGRTWRGA
ncbi:MAG TPA: SelB C-terminal domain-containing protein, partial [Gemmatimonadaceae bacterium]|nr:SelB C-terminal domain-containing protein [Gemmatimonadaceae bacterium]